MKGYHREGYIREKGVADIEAVCNELSYDFDNIMKWRKELRK